MSSLSPQDVETNNNEDEGAVEEGSDGEEHMWSDVPDFVKQYKRKSDGEQAGPAKKKRKCGLCHQHGHTRPR